MLTTPKMNNKFLNKKKPLKNLKPAANRSGQLSLLIYDIIIAYLAHTVSGTRLFF
jgi:hypothetical protein